MKQVAPSSSCWVLLQSHSIHSHCRLFKSPLWKILLFISGSMMIMSSSSSRLLYCFGWTTTTTTSRRVWSHGRTTTTWNTATTVGSFHNQKPKATTAFRKFGSRIYLQVDEQGRTIRTRHSDDHGDDHGERRRGARPRGGGGDGRGRSGAGWNGENTSRSSRGVNQEMDDTEDYNYSNNNNNNNRPSRRPLRGDEDETVMPTGNNDDDDDNAFSWDGERRRSPSRQPAKRGPPPSSTGPYENNRRYDRSSSSSPLRRRDRDTQSSSSSYTATRASTLSSRPSNSGRYGNNQFASSDRNARFNDNHSFGSNINNNRWKETTSSEDAVLGKTNMKALEGAGFVHLYGLSSCRNALRANQREFNVPQEETDRIQQLQQPMSDDHDDDDYDSYMNPTTTADDTTKPQAQFRSWLFVQLEASSSSSSSSRSATKAHMVEEILQLAQERNVPVAYVDRGVLNTLSGNRPHQGYVLRCGKLSFEPLSRIPLPTVQDKEEEENDNAAAPSAAAAPFSPWLWLVLDEVVDPQNLGALIRTAYFLGNHVGILVCAKNSAPPSAVVSAASAGALEVATIYSTANLPRTLQQAQQDGFRIIGASSSPPPPLPPSSSSSRSPSRGGVVVEEKENAVRQEKEEEEEDRRNEPNVPSVYDLQDLPTTETPQPTLLVLGSEGHGLRTLVARTCTEFVRIPSGNNDGDDDASVDSLNVSVTGGILLWHLLRQRN